MRKALLIISISLNIIGSVFYFYALIAKIESDKALEECQREKTEITAVVL